MEKNWSEQEYEMQLFSVDRILVKQAVRDLVMDRIEVLKEDAYRDLTEGLTLDDQQKEVMRLRLERIANFFKQKSIEPLRKIDEAIDEHMSIPDPVLLPMDEGCTRSDDERSRLMADVDQLKNRAISASVGVQVLRQKITQAQSESLERCLKAASVISDMIKNRADNCHSSASLLKAHSSIWNNGDT